MAAVKNDTHNRKASFDITAELWANFGFGGLDFLTM